ncbi:sugar ABC transporter permease [Nonomuraea antimicrobica]
MNSPVNSSMNKVKELPGEAIVAAAQAPSIKNSFLAYVQRVRGGDMGALPAVLGLVVLCVVFAAARPSFVTAINFANLFTQGAAITLIAMGLVFVLLLGEIDLSAGFASGVCAAVLAVTLTGAGLPWYVCVPAAVLTGVIIGTVLGTLVAKVGIPSFVVTLAAFLAFQGLVLVLVDEGTNISIRDSVVVAIANRNLAPWLGWVLYAVCVGVFAGVQLRRAGNRARRGLVADPLSLIAFRVGLLALFAGLAVFALNLERSRNPALVSLTGVPIVVPLILALLIAWTLVLRRTAFGRHLYAVGGNTEAARRAGIPVDRIKISAFVICSAMAAVGGIVAASRASSVDPNTGGSSVLLYAVGAAVIGGTSLFGGKGRVLDAVLGGAVVAVIENGMGLMGYGSSVKYLVTGSVLLLAAGVDALARKRAAAAGLR